MHGGEGYIAEFDSGKDRAGYSKNCGGSSNFRAQRIDAYAQHRAADAGQHVKGKGRRASKESLRKLAETPQAPHVEGKVQQASMNESGRDQSPVIAAERVRTNICAPPEGDVGAESHG